MIKIGIVFFSRTDVTGTLARAACQTFEDQNIPVVAHQIIGSEIKEGRFKNQDLMSALHTCDAIIFASPTYMGNVAAQFKAFMTCQDPRKPVPPRRSSPLHKVLSLIKWIRRVGPLSWSCGLHIGLDEQTVGFKGRHEDKLRITFKKAGDGFQCDALCDDGFTYLVFF